MTAADPARKCPACGRTSCGHQFATALAQMRESVKRLDAPRTDDPKIISVVEHLLSLPPAARADTRVRGAAACMLRHFAAAVAHGPDSAQACTARIGLEVEMGQLLPHERRGALEMLHALLTAFTLANGL